MTRLLWKQPQKHSGVLNSEESCNLGIDCSRKRIPGDLNFKKWFTGEGKPLKWNKTVYTVPIQLFLVWINHFNFTLKTYFNISFEIGNRTEYHNIKHCRRLEDLFTLFKIMTFYLAKITFSASLTITSWIKQNNDISDPRSQSRSGNVERLIPCRLLRNNPLRRDPFFSIAMHIYFRLMFNTVLLVAFQKIHWK